MSIWLYLIIALALWVAYRVRVRWIVGRMTDCFEQRLAERTHSAAESQDALLQGFLSASMQLDVAADRLPADSPVKSQLNHILELMSRVSADGREALQRLRTPEAVSIRLEGAFAEMDREFDQHGPELRIVVEGRARRLHPVLRDEVYCIGREAILNAFRHSGGKNIEVVLEYVDDAFQLQVSDDGRGIDPEHLRDHFERHRGLHAMRDHCESIGGQLHVRTRAGEGTTVALVVPARVAFRMPACQRG